MAPTRTPYRETSVLFGQTIDGTDRCCVTKCVIDLGEGGATRRVRRIVVSYPGGDVEAATAWVSTGAGKLEWVFSRV